MVGLNHHFHHRQEEAVKHSWPMAGLNRRFRRHPEEALRCSSPMVGLSRRSHRHRVVARWHLWSHKNILIFRAVWNSNSTFELSNGRIGTICPLVTHMVRCARDSRPRKISAGVLGSEFSSHCVSAGVTSDPEELPGLSSIHFLPSRQSELGRLAIHYLRQMGILLTSLLAIRVGNAAGSELRSDFGGG
jgi:hypothetical protein